MFKKPLFYLIVTPKNKSSNVGNFVKTILIIVLCLTCKLNFVVNIDV
jgi:hypothetical protein